MKTLLLLRHAKSSWDHPELDDHDRPLNKRGQRDAPRMGAWIAEQGLLPERVLTSTAVRAILTVQAMQSRWAEKIPLRELPEFYLASPEQIAEIVRQHGDETSRLMVVGHNPGMEMLLSHLTAGQESFPTCALAWLELSLDSWQDFSLETAAKQKSLWKPKELW